MITTFILCLLAFIAGISIHRLYHEDSSLNRFADSCIFLVQFPVELIIEKVRQHHQQQATEKYEPCQEKKDQ